MKYKTQAEVDAAINFFIAKAIKEEEKRDRQDYESASYWLHHDKAVKWHNKAEALMAK